jgi:uncharacterized protein
MNERHGVERASALWSVVLGLSLVLAAWILGASAIRIANSRGTIAVTGSAKQQIQSDLVVWRGAFTAQTPSLKEGYLSLQANQAVVRAYLAARGIPADQMVFSSISTQTFHVRGPMGSETNVVSGYRLTQTVELRSHDVEKVGTLARESTELIQQGVPFESYPPEYLYTKLADLKVEMLARATKDARARATEMARNSGSRIGRLRSARMGVFQITPAFSNAISDYGVNDTSSPLKDITAVVTLSFEVL